MLIVSDIDGTLADIKHRLHHVTQGKKNWPAFFEGIPQDKPTALGLLLDAAMAAASRPTLVLVTGRSEQHREATYDWLDAYLKNVYNYCSTLYMRRDKDFRPDHIVKEEILRQIEAAYGRPDLVLDDRPSVVLMWRKHGLPVAHHLAGEEDKFY